jgi:hypothetical protein
MKQSKSEIRSKVLKAIAELKEATFDELRNHLEDKGYYVDPILLRETIAYMLRNGIIAKVAKPEKIKFVFRESENPY